MAGLGLNIAQSVITDGGHWQVTMFTALSVLAGVFILVLLGAMAIAWTVTYLRRDVYTEDKRGWSSPVAFGDETRDAFAPDVIDAEFDD
jgi:hypothetical protein